MTFQLKKRIDTGLLIDERAELNVQNGSLKSKGEIVGG